LTIMANKLIPVLCPTCGIEYSAKPSFMSGRASRGKRCPGGHWHTLNSIACYKLKLENAKLKPAKAKKAKPVTLKSLGFGGRQEMYQLFTVMLLAGFDQAMAMIPQSTPWRGVLESAFGNVPNLVREGLNAVG